MKMINNCDGSIRVEIEKISDRPYYEMKYYGDYHLDEYLQVGSRNIDEFTEFVEKKLIAWNENHNQERIPFGCSAFTAYNAEGDFLFARNMDCECAIPMRIECFENDGHQSLAFLSMSELDWKEDTFDSLEMDAKLTLAAPYSPKDGMNEYGLAVACLTDHQAIYPNTYEKTLFDEMIPRFILDRAKTVEEAVNLLKGYNFFYIIAPLHFFVADRSGASAVIEFVNGEIVTVKNDQKYQIVSNFTLYDNPEHIGFGKDRYEAIEKELSARRGIVSEEEALEILKQNVIPGDEQWSAVYNLTKNTVKITFSGEYEKVYEYRL